MFERKLRLITGLILALFLVLHLLNAALGIFSMELMESGRKFISVLWQNPLGTVILYGALLTHLVLALKTLYLRKTLRMPTWELIQMIFGLMAPLILAQHVAGTRVTQELLGFTVDYPIVVTAIWNDTWYRWSQSLVLLLIWTHACIGIHYWLRLRPAYPGWVPVLYALAILVPCLALLGFMRMGIASEAVLKDPEQTAKVFAWWRASPISLRSLIKDLMAWSGWVMLGIYAVVVAARQVRVLLSAKSATFKIALTHGGETRAAVGMTVLEALRVARIPHASVCGGRARCTTCRVRVGAGLSDLEPSNDAETAALKRINAEDNIRLACQIRPHKDLDITPMLPADADAQQARRPGGVQGREQQVAAMFVDLRGSTALGEKKLPYDVLFILNRFFEEMAESLSDTEGHYAQFAGDGLMALYGLKSTYSEGCRHALLGAVEMHRRMAALNQRLAPELEEPLKIGIGIHGGEAIVGTMGPPSSPNFSAIGDNINIAARLEQQTKTYQATLVVSEAVAQEVGLDLSHWACYSMDVRGRKEPINVYATDDPSELVELLAQ